MLFAEDFVKIKKAFYEKLVLYSQSQLFGLVPFKNGKTQNLLGPDSHHRIGWYRLNTYVYIYRKTGATPYGFCRVVDLKSYYRGANN